MAKWVVSSNCMVCGKRMVNTQPKKKTIQRQQVAHEKSDETHLVDDYLFNQIKCPFCRMVTYLPLYAVYLQQNISPFSAFYLHVCKK